MLEGELSLKKIGLPRWLAAGISDPSTVQIFFHFRDERTMPNNIPGKESAAREAAPRDAPHPDSEQRARDTQRCRLRPPKPRCLLPVRASSPVALSYTVASRCLSFGLCLFIALLMGWVEMSFMVCVLI